ncbi:MAG TPA: hypothetical protein VHY08_17840 [Bacillota bacterium]|nr:hypothetical protein [Bacillota bacterium]
MANVDEPNQLSDKAEKDTVLDNNRDKKKQGLETPGLDNNNQKDNEKECLQDTGDTLDNQEPAQENSADNNSISAQGKGNVVAANINDSNINNLQGNLNKVYNNCLFLFNNEKDGKSDEYNKIKELTEADRDVSSPRKPSLDGGMEPLSEFDSPDPTLTQENPHTWFNGLSQNAKVYAMLVVLFDGVIRIPLEEIYINAVHYLKEKGVSNLEDPRNIGLDDIFEKIKAQENEAHLVDFRNKTFREEVYRQIPSHRPLLWTLIDMIIDSIDIYKEREYWEFRKSLGIAIGRLGIYYKHKLGPILENLARNEHGGVIAVIGYILDEICRSSNEQSYVMDLLKKWVDSGEPDLMWAAAASIWRVYDGLAMRTNSNQEISGQAESRVTDLLAIFTKLVQTFNQFNAEVRYKAFEQALDQTSRDEYTFTQFLHGFIKPSDEVSRRMQEQLDYFATNNLRAILHAIRQIAWTYPQDMVKLVIQWLAAKKDSNLYNIGGLAGRQLFDQYTDPEIHLSQEHISSLIELVGPLSSIKVFIHNDKLDNSDNVIVNTMFGTLLIWLQRPGWTDIIHQALLRVVNRLTPDQSAIFRTRISTIWRNTDSAEIRRVAQSLISRSYLSSGVPLCPPGSKYGVIALDASADSSMDFIAPIGFQLYERFNPLLDIFVTRMGETDPVVYPGQTPSLNIFQVKNKRSRLLLPSLEALPPKRSFVLSLTWGSPLDLSDIPEAERQGNLIVSSAKAKIQSLSNIPIVLLDAKTPSPDLSTIELVVWKQLARTVFSIPSEEWRQALEPYLQTDSLDLPAVRAQLEQWISQLDAIESVGCPIDSVRIIIGTVLWLASQDLSACVELLKEWLTGNELCKLMGNACGQTLFRIYSHGDPIPPVKTHQVLMELAPLLVNPPDWSSAVLIFKAIRSWSEDPGWARYLLANIRGWQDDVSGSILTRLLAAVLPDQAQNLFAELKKWRQALEPKKENDPVPETGLKLVDHLRLSALLTLRKPLPDLPEGHRYGLIVFDALARNQNENKFQAALIRNIIRKLNETKHEQLELRVYQLGDDYPVLPPSQEPTLEAFLGKDFKTPRLMSPLLEKYTPDNVAFLLLFTNNPIVDQDDWLKTGWKEQVMLYSLDNTLNWTKSYTSIPRQSSFEDTVAVIVQHLEKKVG